MYLTAQQQKRIKPFAFYLRYKWFCTDRSDTESNTVNAVMDSPEVRKSSEYDRGQRTWACPCYHKNIRMVVMGENKSNSNPVAYHWQRSIVPAWRRV